MKDLIIDLFQKDLDREFILSIKGLDLDTITNEVLMYYDPITLDNFIFEALNRYKNIVLSLKRYRPLQEIVELSTDWDSYIHIYENRLQSMLEFSVESFIEDYGLEEKLAKLAYQLKEELENFRNL